MLSRLETLSTVIWAICFPVSIFCLRQTVLSLLEAGPVTHNVWVGIRRLSWGRRIGFTCRALRTQIYGTTDEGWTEILRSRFTQEEVQLFQEAQQMGQAPPVFPKQVVAGARTAAWGWLCATFALVAFVAQVLAHVFHWLA